MFTGCSKRSSIIQKSFINNDLFQKFYECCDSLHHSNRYGENIGYTIQPVTVATIQKNTVAVGGSTPTANSTSATYEKKKEVTIFGSVAPSGSMTVNFTGNTVGGAAGYARVYYNGQAIGTERNLIAGAGVVFTEDFTFTNLQNLDKIQIYMKNTGGSTTSVWNFEIRATIGLLANTLV